MLYDVPLRVIYVEDEPAVQRLVQFWLEDAGYEVRVEDDGKAGLAAIRADRPDLVITDALMPEMTGDDMVVEMKNDPELRHIPIIMATAAASPVRVKRMKELGVLEVVAKPMDEETFLKAVRSALEA